ncbi:YjjG family noncanonical pyrimidine nucleotidase [Flavobacterium cellulosilyticum]|uniref:Noncanonical pyrimidine nucleotidase, YjjG family n=1 Tax=Flavobacterium cellulosilyticum TaxID=2541731 RepID=A0A4R5CG93_9FLAO|nr:YjjG family noncanonical pyrimidine nucleotidase [Flavobacterium cellulosilyticum]TDD96274.1 noncanonical pyrimidine nucleotidase, YjjG family [Flavobacterium cellulosilyticum]
MKVINNISDVFFDLDHTLWDFEKNSALAFETIFKLNKMPIDMVQFLHFYIPKNREYWEKYRKDEITQEKMRFGRLKDTLDLIQFDVEDDLINQLSKEYIHYLPQYNHLYEGTIELLDYLRPKYNLHIITNGFASIQGHKLDNSYITHYFKTITNSEMAGVKKPNRLIFEYALNSAKAKKENSIMIGDCIESDVQGALDAGLDAIFFNENNIEVGSHIKQVSQLLDLKKYL